MSWLKKARKRRKTRKMKRRRGKMKMMVLNKLVLAVFFLSVKYLILPSPLYTTHSF